MARVRTDDGRVIRLAARLAPWLAKAGGEAALAGEMDEALYASGKAARPVPRRAGAAVPPGPTAASHLAAVFCDFPLHMLAASALDALERAAEALAGRHPPGTVGFLLLDLWERATAAWPGGHAVFGSAEAFLAGKLGLPARAVRLALAQHMGIPTAGAGAHLAWPTFLHRTRHKGMTPALALAVAADEFRAALAAARPEDMAAGNDDAALLGEARDSLARMCQSFARLLRMGRAGPAEAALEPDAKPAGKPRRKKKGDADA